MLTLVIILGCILTYLIVGQVAVVAMAPSIARRNMRVSGVELEYEQLYGSKKIWREITTQVDRYEYQPTGSIRGLDGERHVNEYKFRTDMILMRWLWFIFLPGNFVKSSNTNLLEKNDPATAKRKEAEADARQKAIEAKTQELQDREDALREKEAEAFNKEFDKAVELR